MKKINLINTSEFTLVGDDDYEKLFYIRRSKQKGKRTLYARKSNGGKLMHRVILDINNPKVQVDHIDGNGLNNQKNNLRLASNQQNSFNQIKQLNRSSQFKGVSWEKQRKKWEAYIKINKRKLFLGYFFQEKDAAKAYNKKALELFGEFAKLNNI